MIEQPRHALEGRGSMVTCAGCGRRFQVVGKIPKNVVQPPCPDCGHEETKDE